MPIQFPRLGFQMWAPGDEPGAADVRRAQAENLRSEAAARAAEQARNEAIARAALGLNPEDILTKPVTTTIPGSPGTPDVTQDIPFNPDRPERAGLIGPSSFTPGDMQALFRTGILRGDTIRGLQSPGNLGYPSAGPGPTADRAAIATIPGLPATPERQETTRATRSAPEAVLELYRRLGPGATHIIEPFARAVEAQARLQATRAERFVAVDSGEGYPIMVNRENPDERYPMNTRENVLKFLEAKAAAGRDPLLKVGGTESIYPRAPLERGEQPKPLIHATEKPAGTMSTTPKAREVHARDDARKLGLTPGSPQSEAFIAQRIEQLAEESGIRVAREAAGATTTSRAEATRHQLDITPIGMAPQFAGRTWTREGKLVSTGTVGEAMRSGALTFPDAEASKSFSMLMEATDKLPDLEKLGEKVYTAGKQSWITKLGGSVGEVARNFAVASAAGQAFDPDAAAFFRQVDSLVPTFSRLAGDPRLSDLDRRTWRGVLGSSFNTLESFKATMHTIRDSAKKTRDRYVSGHSVPVKSMVESSVVESRGTFIPPRIDLE